MQTAEDGFVKALMGEDELGVVIRAQIHIEAHLYELVERLGADPKYLRKMHLEYEQLVNLAVALGLKDESTGPLLALGNMRNAFAHRIDASLTKDRVESLYKTLTPSDKEIAQRVYLQTNTQLKINESSKSLRDLTPKDQFILIAAALRGMLLAAISQLKRD